jgi:prepilin-type processing-associated H-X9-DG protein
MLFQSARLVLITAFIVLVLPIQAQPTTPTPAEDTEDCNCVQDDPRTKPKDHLEIMEKVLHSFVSAINHDDVAAASRLVQGGQEGAPLEQIKLQLQKVRGTLQYEDSKVSLLRFVGKDNHAIVKIRLGVKNSLNNRITHDESVIMQMVDRWDWKIVPLSIEEFKRSLYDQDEEESNVLTNLATYFGQPQAIKEIHTYKCHDNLMQLGAGARYSPLKANDFRKVLLFHLKNEDVFHCPDQRVGSAYSFNPRLENIDLEKIQQSAQTVLFYEGKDGKLDFRHDNRAGVCFADGHAELVTPERAKTLKWNP